MAKNKSINPKDYCTQLVNAPDINKTYTEKAELYCCRITQKPCVARSFYDTDMDSNSLSTYFPRLNDKLLHECPAYNLPNELTNPIINHRKRQKIS